MSIAKRIKRWLAGIADARLAFRAVLVVFIVTTFSGCTTNDNKRAYRLDEIKFRVIHEEDQRTPTTYLIFSTLSETHFYSPGVKLRQDKENNIDIEFVKAAIRDKTPDLDVKAEYLSKWIEGNTVPIALKEKMLNKATPSEQIILIQGEITSISITDENRRKTVWTKAFKVLAHQGD